jgi:hypothetical protein
MAPNTTQRSGTSGSNSGGSNRAGKPGKKPIKPVKPPRPWGLIALGVAVVVGAGAIITYAALEVRSSGQPLEGIANYRKTDPAMLAREHVSGPQTYKVLPPVGGNHNAGWQNCQGDVYPAQIANEHAVHSMEHGAVWITYRPGLPQAQIDKLTEKVRGQDYLLMSPYPGLDKPISLQAWGYQLKVDSADDARVDGFIRAYRVKASVEPGATCGQGVTTTGTTPQG